MSVIECFLPLSSLNLIFVSSSHFSLTSILSIAACFCQFSSYICLLIPEICLSVCGRHISRTVHLIIFALGVCTVKGPRKCRIAVADVIAFLKLDYSKLVGCYCSSLQQKCFLKIVTFRLDDCPLVVEWHAQMEAQAPSTWVLIPWLSPTWIWQDLHVPCYSQIEWDTQSVY